MTLFSYSPDKDLPMAFDGCKCQCHVTTMFHITPCCYPPFIKNNENLNGWTVDIIDDFIIHFKAPNQYQLTSAFVRLQEYYESPFVEICEKYFTLEKFMDIYASNNKNVFSYYEDWAGFNIPGNVVNNFKNIFNDLSEKEKFLLKFTKKFEEVDYDKYYVIGTYSDKDINHEIAHAFYYSSQEDYKSEMDEITNMLPNEILSLIKNELLKTGYNEKVILDEIQAYLATSTYIYLKKEFGLNKNIIENFVKKYRKIFKKYTKGVTHDKILCSE